MGAAAPAGRAVTTARLGVLVLAVLAYVPALLSSPGRMQADTKLYLYLDPRRLLADSVWTFDGRQFAGWVPHQVIAYGWPSGPWYVVAQAAGLPDWVAHRLWIGTIMFAAGTGVAWAARRLGLSVEAALAAGLVYQLSPYLVPYISRTSSMLLPWAGLGWIVGLTVGAALRTRWRDAALCALVVGTVGAVNTTALLMIAPAPVLWLVVAAAERTVPVRRAVVTAAKVGVLSLATSAWWLVMQVVQTRHGVDLLAYSESLEDVSVTSTSAEAWRSLGYWLTYVRDAYAPTTTAGRAYLADLMPIVCGYLIVVVALTGLALSRFPARRFAIAMTATGLVLAVGVHPFDDAAPIASLVRGDGQDGLSLALRSSTRALPLLAIGTGLGIAAIVDAAGRRVAWRRLVLTVAVGVVALGNLPVLTGRQFLDPALERDEHPPAAWLEAAAALDGRPDGYRVLQLPGAEFGAFTWGYTVDPPLPSLTDRPLVTRDLLPLGSPGAMDLLYALDDRFQEGWPELDAVAPVARLLGVDTIWLPGDAAFDRFRTPRPELVAELFAAGATGLGRPVAYGAAAVNAAQVPMVDEQSMSEPAVGSPVAPVELVTVNEPVPIVRASSAVVVLSGSGDGLVDAAAAGLIAGDEAILYSAGLGADDLIDAAADADDLVVTDSNRRRAHHWRGSQETTGYTEASTGSVVRRSDSGDARLEVFPGAGAETFTTAVQDGPLAVAASSYGERFSYQPEQRPGLAIDGDPNTAWTVLDPVGQYLEVTTESGVDHVTLLQPNGLAAVRRLGTVTLTVDGGESFVVELDERSSVAGQRVDIAATTGPTTIRIALGTVEEATGGWRPDRTPVGVAEVDLGVGSSPEVVAVPTDLTAATRRAGLERPVTYVLTRQRVDPTDRWRSDPEWRIARRLDVPSAQSTQVVATVRLDRRASDSVVAELVGIDGPMASARLIGVPSAGGWAAADGDVGTAWITPFNQVVGASLGVELVDPRRPIELQQRTGNHSEITAVHVIQGARRETVLVEPGGETGQGTIDIPDGFAAGPLTIEVAAVVERTTRDRRFGDTVLMPAAVSEVGNVSPSSLPERFDTGCRDDLVTVDGAAVGLRVTGTVEDAFSGSALQVTPCGDGAGSLTLEAGTHDVIGQHSRRGGLQIDRIVLAAGADAHAAGAAAGDAAADDTAGPTATVIDQGRTARTIGVEGCADGCWLIVGEGHHPSWSAATAGGSLGPAVPISGGFNGWWIPPHDGDTLTVWVRWTAQAPLDVAIAVSVASAFVAVVLIVTDRRRRRVPAASAPRWARLTDDGLRRSIAAGALWVALAALFVDGGWALWGLAGGAIVVVTRRIRLAGLVAVAAVGRIAVDVVITVWRDAPPATPGFPLLFEDLHRLGLFAAVALAVSALARPAPNRVER